VYESRFGERFKHPPTAELSPEVGLAPRDISAHASRLHAPCLQAAPARHVCYRASPSAYRPCVAKRSACVLEADIADGSYPARLPQTGCAPYTILFS